MNAHLDEPCRMGQKRIMCIDANTYRPFTLFNFLLQLSIAHSEPYCSIENRQLSKRKLLQ